MTTLKLKASAISQVFQEHVTQAQEMIAKQMEAEAFPQSRCKVSFRWP